MSPDHSILINRRDFRLYMPVMCEGTPIAWNSCTVSFPSQATRLNVLHSFFLLQEAGEGTSIYSCIPICDKRTLFWGCSTTLNITIKCNYNYFLKTVIICKLLLYFEGYSSYYSIVDFFHIRAPPVVFYSIHNLEVGNLCVHKNDNFHCSSSEGIFYCCCRWCLFLQCTGCHLLLVVLLLYSNYLIWIVVNMLPLWYICAGFQDSASHAHYTASPV